MNFFKYIVLSFCLVFTVQSCKEKVEEKEEVLRPVKFQVVESGSAQRTRTFSGVAKAGDEIELSFRSSGIISVVNISKGQKVKKGDLLAKLDNVEASLAYEQTVSAVNSAKSDLNTAQNERDRIKTLYEKGSKSLSDYEKARNSYESALAQYESAKRNRGIQATQLSYGVIKAPKDGLIADTEGEIGERVSAGHQFAVLNAGSDMKIEIGLPENVVNKVKTEMAANIVFSSLDGASFEGTVLEVAPVVDADAATFETSIGINDPIDDIKPGMAANVTFNFENADVEVDDGIIIPVKSVGEDSGGNFVFLIESENGVVGTVKRQTIELGNLTSEGFKVKSGLTEGQKIATAGLQTLLDGQKVKLQ